MAWPTIRRSCRGSTIWKKLDSNIKFIYCGEFDSIEFYLQFTMDVHFIQQAELQNRQNYGETADDAFRAAFGKEQPGRLRCYSRSVTTCFWRKMINNLKQKHANEITYLKEELREEMWYLFTQLLQNNHGLNFKDIPGCVGSIISSPVDESSAEALGGTHLQYSSWSSHDSVFQKVFCISHSLLIVCILFFF